MTIKPSVWMVGHPSYELAEGSPVECGPFGAVVELAKGVTDMAAPSIRTRRLGHTSVRVILDAYGHLFEGMDEAHR